MAGKMYVSKGYSIYTYIPDLHGGYDHGSKDPMNDYIGSGSPSKVYVHSPTMSSSSSSSKFNNGEVWTMKTNNISDEAHSKLGATHHHALTTLTDNTKEPSGFQDSVNHSPLLDLHQRGFLDELSTHAQTLETEKRYGRPTFVAKANDIYKKRYQWL
ncbi:unnamed protein product [Lactuca virosa]|uniref:Uncharacterized protein n=1 Tax=Lactuca virosa TaxID=75947 RepID=A0AAU9N5P4_9ASTR|nr:unnamed protein product [Lactuca virosa]